MKKSGLSSYKSFPYFDLSLCRCCGTMMNRSHLKYSLLYLLLVLISSRANDDGHLRKSIPRARNLQLISQSAMTVKACSKRTGPPVNGTRCSRDPKTCFFGTLNCTGSSPPIAQTKCVCSGRIWTCTAESCPKLDSASSPNGCTPEGVADLSGNSPLCPVISPVYDSDSSSSCIPDLYGTICKYGSETWYVLLFSLVGFALFRHDLLSRSCTHICDLPFKLRQMLSFHHFRMHTLWLVVHGDGLLHVP